jgi:hypothetical protein
MARNFTKSLFLTLISLFLVVTINAQNQHGGVGSNARKNIINNGNVHSPNLPSSNGLTQLYSATGHYFLSADGAGSASTGGTNTFNIQVNKPTATATVHKAIFMSTSTTTPIPAGCVTLAGNTIAWDASISAPFAGGSFFFYNYEADVTSIVAPLINPLGAGISNLSIGECFIPNTAQGVEGLDGEALLVIFNDATATEKTVLIMWGACNVAGDSYSIVLGAPINPLDPASLLDMGLGISYSAPPGQYSQIDVNGQRLTTAASGWDDGALINGALITVGGIGDSDGNPVNPFALPSGAFDDDELYSLLPFITNTTTNITVATFNASLDDNIFMSYFELSGSAIILNGAGIVLAQSTSSGCNNITHTVTATVVDAQSNPIPGVMLHFIIPSGPHAGLIDSVLSNQFGQASFTYPGNGLIGTDVIRSFFIIPQSQPPTPQYSNDLSFQWLDCTVCIPTLSQWGLIILALLFLAAEMVYLRKRQYSFAVAGDANVSEKRISLFDRRSYFMILAVMLGIAMAVFTIEIMLSISVPVRDIVGALISSAILAYILQLFNAFRKD